MDAVSFRAAQQAAGAVFGNRAAAHYGDAKAEYRTVREGAGIVDRSSRGLIRATGSDRLRFIGGMVTNRVEGLDAGAGNHASLTDARGQTFLDLWVHNRGDYLILETDPGLQEKLYTSLDKYLIADDVELTDVTDQWAMLGVQGPGADDLIARVIGRGGEGLAEHHSREVVFDGTPIVMTARSYTGEPGFDLWLVPDGVRKLFEALVASGGTPVGTEALEWLRVEAGIPRYGQDVDETVTPLEAGLFHTVDFDKGCYIGQETIAKMHYRGKPRRYLVGLKVEGGDVVEAGHSVQVDGKAVGRVTSSVYSPGMGQVIALALLRRGFEDPGRTVDLDGAGRAEVVGLPFCRG